MFASEVKRIERDYTVLVIHHGQERIEKTLPAAVFILIGDVLPFELLRRIGIRFGVSPDPESPLDPSV